MWIFENDYALAWSLYLLGALLGLTVWFKMTGWMWRWLREPLQVLMAVLLFTPTLVDPERNLMAPALAIVALDLVFGVGQELWRAVSDLVLYALVGLALYAVLVIARWLLGRRGSAEDGRTLSERMEDTAPGAVPMPASTRAEPRI
ncbi:MFS transporter [Stutzerimonas tarimensis]|uniref:MFS transporter n=1 Tax=Stutzerimonas tarimensis TaxID=1507735 RepID=A0ABV7T1X1_9GAMM